ncbi:hypothetical protein NQ318_017389 [Aromia moschata]|uniref:ferroxidase n=1 Tax=Aromia moschata TaxID=1265417 RepID=A0AAV8Z4Y0_9CUCU|nr:hypothetical protein NQ318_017389 [Aromia moschata]
MIQIRKLTVPFLSIKHFRKLSYVTSNKYDWINLGWNYCNCLNEKYPLQIISKDYNLRSKLYSTSVESSDVNPQVTFNTFDRVCEETLESLTEFFEDLIESKEKLSKADVSYSDGVLTINLGEYGTYVINRQTPNKQIWLSSPVSGPKRYDYVASGGHWTYKYDAISLHELLQKEISKILGENVDFSKCLYAKV